MSLLSATQAIKRLSDIWGKDPMRDMYIALCALGWIWTFFAAIYLAWRLRKQQT